MPGLRFEIEVPITAEWRNIELLRTAVLNCLSAMFQNQTFCHGVSTVAGELLENAVKYGDWARPDVSAFRLRVYGDQAAIHLETWNAVAPQSRDAEVLERTVSWIAGFASPQQAFEARLRELANRAPGDNSSRLGLARVAYETSCTIEA